MSLWFPLTEMHAVPLFQSQSDSLKSKTKYPNALIFSQETFYEKMKTACKENMLREASLPSVFPEEKNHPIEHIWHLYMPC